VPRAHRPADSESESDDTPAGRLASSKAVANIESEQAARRQLGDRLYGSPRFTDVVILVKGTHFPAHRVILWGYSEFFRPLIPSSDTDTMKASASVLPVVDLDGELPPMRADLFATLLHYIYKATLPFNFNEIITSLLPAPSGACAPPPPSTSPLPSPSSPPSSGSLPSSPSSPTLSRSPTAESSRPKTPHPRRLSLSSSPLSLALLSSPTREASLLSSDAAGVQRSTYTHPLAECPYGVGWVVQPSHRRNGNGSFWRKGVRSKEKTGLPRAWVV